MALQRVRRSSGVVDFDSPDLRRFRAVAGGDVGQAVGADFLASGFSGVERLSWAPDFDAFRPVPDRLGARRRPGDTDTPSGSVRTASFRGRRQCWREVGRLRNLQVDFVARGCVSLLFFGLRLRSSG